MMMWGFFTHSVYTKSKQKKKQVSVQSPQVLGEGIPEVANTDGSSVLAAKLMEQLRHLLGWPGHEGS